MKVIIVGAGRMGIRHGQGICSLPEVNQIRYVDISDAALNNAETQMASSASPGKFIYGSLQQALDCPDHFEVAILASTASDRIALCKKLLGKGIRHFLIEKPLGQSLKEVTELTHFFQGLPNVTVSVNLNMRMYPFVSSLKKDLSEIPQLQGEKTITVNTGTLGIGANGIHYLDLLYYLIGASKAELVAGEIEDSLIPSGRGPQFSDFGGWCVIKYYDGKNQYLGKAFLSMSSKSTVFGGWDIVASHGRISFDEIEQTRFNKYRKADSQLPFNRYAGDYMPLEKVSIESPFLGDLTREWLSGIIKGKNLLPDLRASQEAHKLMFDWLSMSRNHKEFFPIT